MNTKSKLINTWPSNEQVDYAKTKERFPDLKIVSGCVEFHTQVPGGPTSGKLMLSHYKNSHADTNKVNNILHHDFIKMYIGLENYLKIY